MLEIDETKIKVTDTVLKEMLDKVEFMYTSLNDESITQDEWLEWSKKFNKQIDKVVNFIDEHHSEWDVMPVSDATLRAGLMEIHLVWRLLGERYTTKTGKVVGMGKYKKLTNQYQKARKRVLKNHNRFVNQAIHKGLLQKSTEEPS